MRWDDSAWTGDREGGYQFGPPNTGRRATFKTGAYRADTSIAYNEGNLVPLGSSAAPTRGSSPVPNFRRPQTKAEEDEEMQQALANSRQGLAQDVQETGVVATSGNLHPATKNHYDPNSWAMTVHGTTNVHETREIVLDVEAADRQNQPGQPRFLKHLPSGDYLPSLLTIAHSIPMAREAMLMRSHVQPSYGQDSEWWRGHAIRLPRIVNLHDGTVEDPESAKNEEMVIEVQRLMAILDSSDRSYGCIDSLTTIANERAQAVNVTAETIMDTVLQGWESAASALGTNYDSIFHSVVGSTVPSGVKRQDMWSLPFSISEEDRRRSSELTLADVMDSTLWDADMHDEGLHDTFMEQCAEILAMRVTQDGLIRNTLGLVVPPILYVDKYLKENIGSSRALRKQILEARKRITQVEELQLSLASMAQGPGQGFLDVLEIMQSTQGMLSGATRDAVLAEYEARGLDLPPGALDTPEPQKTTNEEMAAKLGDLWSKITAKVKALDEEKKKTRELLSQLSQVAPPEIEDSGLKNRYTLRGVSTKPNVTYILRPKPQSQGDTFNNEGLMDLPADAVLPQREEVMDDTLDDPDAPPGWMWWRLEFDSTHSPGRIMKTESTQDDVLRAVELEHSSALLVYASDEAMDFGSGQQLPEPLATFVKTDNRLFRQELMQSGGDAGVQTMTPGHGPVRSTNAAWSNRDRRGSQGSTTVNFDSNEDSGHGIVESQEMDEAPPYYDDAAHYGYEGDKTNSMGGQTWSRLSPEVHEIHLEDASNDGIKTDDAGPEVPPAANKAADRRSVAMGGMNPEEGGFDEAARGEEHH